MLFNSSLKITITYENDFKLKHILIFIVISHCCNSTLSTGLTCSFIICIIQFVMQRCSSRVKSELILSLPTPLCTQSHAHQLEKTGGW